MTTWKLAIGNWKLYTKSMSDNGGIGQKLLEVGVSAAKATAQEVKTTVSEASSQLTGNNIRSDSELKNIAASDEVYKTQRMGEIKKRTGKPKNAAFSGSFTMGLLTNSSIIQTGTKRT